jgi:ribosomal protein S18 acetylase RimI-like enzyme
MIRKYSYLPNKEFFTSQVNGKKFFIWQIGVFSYHRGKEIGKMLLDKIEKTAKKIGCNSIELTVDPENVPSQKFFEKNGYLNISSREGETVEVRGNTAVKDYYKPGRHFILFEKNI